MGLSFGNPLGFIALLGIPTVIAIHFLQRRSKQALVSTLFPPPCRKPAPRPAEQIT